MFAAVKMCEFKHRFVLGRWVSA